MLARLRSVTQRILDAFWLLPTALVIGLAGIGGLLVDLQSSGTVPGWLPTDWAYGGGETGARTLLGAIASSTIAVAGTLFSITIAALTLASNQMGPRLLRNFMRDRGNQTTLGILLGTFAYALVVLRSVRGGDQETFVPALGVTVGLALAAACVGALIYFVQHMAGRINVDTVIGLVYGDLAHAIERLTTGAEADAADPTMPDMIASSPQAHARALGGGYVEQFDAAGLAAWAAESGVRVWLHFRVGQFVPPGAVIAVADPPVRGLDEAVRRATAIGGVSASGVDLTYPVRQLVEVALRALSPGINDPQTAINVIDRLGAALALLAGRRLPPGVIAHDGEPRLAIPALTYDELLTIMFDMIRNSAGGAPSVLIHLLRVLATVAEIETDQIRLEDLRRMADAVKEQGEHVFTQALDRSRLHATYRAFLAVYRPEFE